MGLHTNSKMADQVKKRRTFKKFSYRGIDLDDLLNMSTEEFTNMTNSRHRRSLRRGLKKKHSNLIAKLNKEKLAVQYHGTTKASQDPPSRHHDPPTDGWKHH